MSAEKRITKRQMKGDRLVSTTFKATEYIQKNQTPFVIGTVAILAVFALVVIMRWNTNRKTSEASGILTRAEMSAAVGELNLYFSDLQLLSDNYGGTSAGKIATLRLANNAFDSEDYKTARVFFERIIERYSDDKTILASACAGLAAGLEMQGDFKQAGEYYQKAADASEGEIWASNYLYKAGINYASAGEKEAARTAFKIIEEKYQNTAEYTLARRALAEISY